MAPLTFSLIELRSGVEEPTMLSKLTQLSSTERPLFVGRCQHWIHSPQLSATALLGSGPAIKRWDYLLIGKSEDSNALSLPKGIEGLTADIWSITADVGEQFLANYDQTHRARVSKPAPPLPAGWSPTDHSGLDAAIAPPDLEASLALSSFPLGSRNDGNQSPVVLKDFVRDFGKRYTSPVSMFNLLSYIAGQKPRYLEYRAAFAASVGSKYGGSAIFGSSGVFGWSSKEAEEGGQAGWEDAALVHYPSIWHFGKMLDDPAYADADRQFKQGALRDNPILCCTEVEVGYVD